MTEFEKIDPRLYACELVLESFESMREAFPLELALMDQNVMEMREIVRKADLDRSGYVVGKGDSSALDVKVGAVTAAANLITEREKAEAKGEELSHE